MSITQLYLLVHATILLKVLSGHEVSHIPLCFEQNIAYITTLLCRFLIQNQVVADREISYEDTVSSGPEYQTIIKLPLHKIATLHDA